MDSMLHVYFIFSENPSKKPPATVTSEPHELEHEIRLRVQELYEERGREGGRALEYWLRAEEGTHDRRLITRTSKQQHTPRTHPGPFCIYLSYP